MPVLVCIGLSVIVYFLLMDSIKDKHKNDDKRIECGKCREKVGATYTFCANCKEKLKDSCNHCNNVIDINWRYCPYCGNTKENR